MSYKLEKTCTEKQRFDFIVEYNHNKGLRIEKGVNGELFALEPFEKLVNDEVIDNTEEYEQEQAQKERERINMLSLTAADVERAIYKDKNMNFEDVLELVEKLTPSQTLPLGEGANPDIDIKALKIELKANNFYRGNPYVEKIGSLLGYSSDELDYLFENGKFAEE